ncbi:hypothetical protein EB796_010824 [Bugula neritina]|uniref:Uncharacterized protein n=1 Tax=Bugula neritina TaxID=10212 RepID=A0A7J7JYV0_BUGNE|nr:hypothetical protein EB796_010824 [Bugula neritina]
MESYKDILQLEELTTKYQKNAESSRNWVHHLQEMSRGCYNNIGNVYSDMGEYSKALEYYRKCLKMQLTVYGSDAVHEHIASSYNNIGNV